MSFKRELLLPLGWNDFFEQQKLELKTSDWVPARVIGEERGFYRLQSLLGTHWGELAGIYRHSAEDRLALPSTGDWVACTPQSGGDRAIVHATYQRKSCLTRKISGTQHEEQILAANVDTAFITTAIGEDLNPRRLERYLALVWEGGATPVVLLTKADLVDDPAEALAILQGLAVGVEVLAISTIAEKGLDALRPYFEGNRTSVLLGSSGVGKSTLVNRLLGEAKLKTQEVREADGKGRHTTTSRYLFQLPQGGLLIDTPGMRELGLTDHEEGVATLFDDIEAIAQTCRFTDCHHKTEPGCAVKAALASGELAADRMEAYEKLLREIDFEKRKTDKGFASESRKNWKSIAKSLKSMKKKKP